MISIIEIGKSKLVDISNDISRKKNNILNDFINVIRSFERFITSNRQQFKEGEF